MPELHSEYRELFCLQTFQRGRPMAFALSPTGRWICSASDYGDLLIQRSTRGYVYCHVGMGRLYHVTAITWATDFQIILGCFNGAVYVATLTLNPNENQIKITHLLDDVVSPVRALAYDIDQKLLALGYRGRVSVWRRSVGKDRARAWKTVDIFRTSIGDLPAKVNTLCFFGPNKCLFLGLDSGAMIWFASGRMTVFDMGTQPYRIGAVALSSDGSTMAVSTLDQSIVIWPVSSEGPIANLAHEYVLESGRELHRFEPYTPVVLTSDVKVACGTLDGTIAILLHTGSCVQKIRKPGHCTRALAADKDMLYASYTSAIGFTTIVTYCNNDARRKSLKEKHDLHPESGRDTHFYPFHKVYKSPKKQAHTTIKYLHKTMVTNVLAVAHVSRFLGMLGVH